MIHITMAGPGPEVPTALIQVKSPEQLISSSWVNESSLSVGPELLKGAQDGLARRPALLSVPGLD
jgi:hypothetical protein